VLPRGGFVTQNDLDDLIRKGAQLLWPSELSLGSSGDDRVRVVLAGTVAGYCSQAQARNAVDFHDRGRPSAADRPTGPREHTQPEPDTVAGSFLFPAALYPGPPLPDHEKARTAPSPRVRARGA
jgi:hypothetical protein